MHPRKLKKELEKVIYWERINVSESSLDQPISATDDDSLTLLDTLGFEEEFDDMLDAQLFRQQIIFSLPEIEQVQILILKQFGYKYWEIKRILRLRSLSHYFQIFHRLRKNYLKAAKKLRERDDII